MNSEVDEEEEEEEEEDRNTRKYMPHKKKGRNMHTKEEDVRSYMKLYRRRR